MAVNEKVKVKVYRIALGIAALSALMPWAKASGTAMVLGEISSLTITVAGLKTTWDELEVRTASL